MSMSNGLMQSRSLVEGFANRPNEIESLLRQGNQLQEANLVGQYQNLAVAHDTNDRLYDLLSAVHQTNGCLLHLSDDISELRRSTEASEAMFRELLARDSLQARMEEFVYQLEKLVASFSDDKSALVTQYLAYTGILGVIADDQISTVVIRGRENKSAFNNAYEAAKKIQEQLASQPKVKQWLKDLADKRNVQEREKRESQERQRLLDEEQRQRMEDERRRKEEEDRREAEERWRIKEEQPNRLRESISKARSDIQFLEQQSEKLKAEKKHVITLGQPDIPVWWKHRTEVAVATLTGIVWLLVTIATSGGFLCLGIPLLGLPLAIYAVICDSRAFKAGLAQLRRTGNQEEIRQAEAVEPEQQRLRAEIKSAKKVLKAREKELNNLLKKV